jgi:ureidoglycolate lyase
MSKLQLTIEPLTQEAFAPYGEVIETEGRDHFLINKDHTKRFHQLANVQLDERGQGIISIFEATTYAKPLKIDMMEHHPFGSQAFVPMSEQPFLLVVAPKGDSVSVDQLKAFKTNGRQGVNYFAGTWHYPVIALNDGDRFLVVDRTGPGHNCVEHFFEAGQMPTLLT